MSKPAVYLDRDGVINVEVDYLHTVDNFIFIEKTVEALRLIKEKGYQIIIVTNQSGIARGMYTEEDFIKLTEWMDWNLLDLGIEIDGIYYCPHHPEAKVEKYKQNCNCRKPNPGMILDSCKDLDVDLSKSYIVGDKVSDIEAGLKAGIKNTILVRSGHKLSEEDEKKAKAVYNKLYDFAVELEPTDVNRKNSIEKQNSDKNQKFGDFGDLPMKKKKK